MVPSTFLPPAALVVERAIVPAILPPRQVPKRPQLVDVEPAQRVPDKGQEANAEGTIAVVVRAILARFKFGPVYGA